MMEQGRGVKVAPAGNYDYSAGFPLRMNSMSLRARINDDLKTAMKAGDKRKVSALRLMNAAIKDKDINSRTDGHDSVLTADPGLIDLFAKMVKQRQESLGMYEQGGRPELAQQEREEIEVIQSYMPKQLSEDEAKKAVASVIAAVGATSVKDMGKVMAELKAQYAGQMDMAKAGGIVKGLLG
jgi:uncharacterized protein YqeY